MGLVQWLVGRTEHLSTASSTLERMYFFDPKLAIGPGIWRRLWGPIGVRQGCLDWDVSGADNPIMEDDARLFAPAAARNREPIFKVLQRHLPSRGLVLEVASGSGEHVIHFAGASRAELIFQPSDPDAGARASIDAWAVSRGLPNVRPAIAIDAASQDWPIPHADAVICINMIHIAPWAAAAGLVRGASKVLPLGGMLYLYGPFRRNGEHTAPSNDDFDKDLRRRNAEWGVRELESVAAQAAASGFASPVVEEMPANNLSVILRRQV